MQLFSWSPETFHTGYDTGNCEFYVLKKDMSIPGLHPYNLNTREGHMPTSCLNGVVVELEGGETQTVSLKDYLSIPAPRTMHTDIIKRMLHQQHGFVPDKIVSFDL